MKVAFSPQVYSDIIGLVYNRNHNVTWFILFECYPTEYVVKYITNNQYEGQYFNQ